MLKLVPAPRRLAAIAGVFALSAIAGLAGVLASPDALVRMATAEAFGNLPREARVTISLTGDVVVPAADRLAVQTVATTSESAAPVFGVFAAGDRFTVAAAGGGHRTLEVIDVSSAGSAHVGTREHGNPAARLNLVLVTCRVVDQAGRPGGGEIVRFLSAAEPPGQQQLHQANSAPGTL
ncbi:MAG: hypothetical protein R3D27_01545 [Hyphomicrobiaceae bacterium]